MKQSVSPRFQEIMEMIEALPLDEQRRLVEIVRERLIQYQRAELVAQVAEARLAYRQWQGKTSVPTQTYRTETTIASDGTITIVGAPFQAGEKVQVFMSGPQRKPIGSVAYPLRGKPIRYAGPFESIAEDDWEALK